MGNRLSKIYTRTGDDGSTGMADGSRLSKADALFSVMGDVDELNSQIGLVRAHLSQAKASQQGLPERIKEQMQPDFGQALIIIQHLLFNIGGELAMPEFEGINDTHVKWLEQQIDAMNAHLPPLKDFILPTGSVLVSQLHVARTVCRRSERQAVILQQEREQAIRPTAIHFINRLSDWLFVAARFCTDSSQVSEVLWNNQVLINLNAND